MKKFLKVALPIAGVVLAAAGAAIYMTARKSLGGEESTLQGSQYCPQRFAQGR